MALASADFSPGSQERSTIGMAPQRTSVVITPKWYTVPEVAQLLGYGLSKTKMLVVTGELRSLKDGRSRRVLPEWVDEYVARRARESQDIA
jgi:excisionase family DNA binding protein